MRKWIAALIIFLIILLPSSYSIEPEIRFDFEESLEGWAIPDWAYYQTDYKAETVETSLECASSGKSSLKLVCDFPGNIWTAALVELEKDMDFSNYESISVVVFLPQKAPAVFLQAKIILTTGVGWYFTEMRNAVPLVPGKWVTVKEKLESTEVEQSGWMGRGEKSLYKNIQNIRKVAVRVEYNANPPQKVGPRYHGPIYIDNIVIK